MILRLLKRLGSPLDLRHADGGHACGGCGVDAKLGVFEDQARGGLDAEALRGKKEAVRCGLAVSVILGADEGVEFVEEIERGKRSDDGGAAAAGDDR